MKVTNMVIADVLPGDYPDFVDAFCEYAEWEDTGEPLTDEELDDLNEKHSDLVQAAALEQLL